MEQPKLSSVSVEIQTLMPCEKVGACLLPAEDMNWFISKSIGSAAQDLQTRCCEKLPQGGQRDKTKTFKSDAQEMYPKRHVAN